MKFVLLALFVVSSSAFANSEVKKVTTKTETTPAPIVETKTSTETEKKDECVVVDGEEDCKTVHSKKSKTKSKKQVD